MSRKTIFKYEDENLIKKCNDCSIEKPFKDFPHRILSNGIFRPKSHCKNCAKIRDKKYKEKYPNKVKETKNNHKQKNINAIITVTSRICDDCNVDKDFSNFNKCHGKLYNIDSICVECKYNAAKIKYENNKHDEIYVNKIKTQRSVRNKMKIKDPVSKLRGDISSTIRFYLKNNNGSKRGKSIMDYLPYTIEELKNHIESQWKDWMSWENHGRVSLTKKTWHIDHIIPQSKLPFDCMEHPNFLKCWELENLRPLDAIENCKKRNKIIT